MPTNATLLAMSVAVMLAAGCSGGPATNPPAVAKTASATPNDAPAPVKKAHAFRGIVEKIDPATSQLTVNGEDVEGWMAAMTMVYKVDKPEVLARITVGDRIAATVYDGDFGTLHDVVVSAAK